jgi:SAM-dependent methyltransferase
MNIDDLDGITKKRAIDCEYLSLSDKTEEEYLKILKGDWDIRAEVDPSLYVEAASHASEEEIQSSGQSDFEREFLPRVDVPIGVCLELGCGLGRMTQFISRVSGLVVAVDISSKLLEIAKKRLIESGYPNILFVETNGMTLDSIADNFVDTAFEYIVFQHIPKSEIIKSYIKEVHRVLKPGGRFIMHGRDVSGHDSGNMIGNTWHGCRISPEVVRQAIRDTTFIVVSEEGISTDRYWVILEKEKV